MCGVVVVRFRISLIYYLPHDVEYDLFAYRKGVNNYFYYDRSLDIIFANWKPKSLLSSPPSRCMFILDHRQSCHDSPPVIHSPGFPPHTRKKQIRSSYIHTSTFIFLGLIFLPL